MEITDDRAKPSATAGLGNSERCLLWLLANLLLTAVVAWVAFQVQQDEIAPAVLFPLAVGTLLGTGGFAILRFTRLPGARVALLGAIAWGLLAVFGQDYIGHRYRLRFYDDELARQDPLVALATAEQRDMRPDFFAYVAGHLRQQPVWWGLDLVLTCGASLVVTALAIKKERLNTSLSA